jgi:hypothetical protein
LGLASVFIKVKRRLISRFQQQKALNFQLKAFCGRLDLFKLSLVS